MTGPSRSEAFAPFAEAYADPEAHARAHAAAGGKVVGYMSPTGPVELIEAAGLFALRLDGRGSSQTERADAFVERLFDPSVRAVCDRIIGGELAFLDAIVLPRTTDSIQRLYYYLCEIARTTQARMPPVLLFDLLQTPGAASAAYTRARLRDLAAQLEAIAGRAMTEEDLRRAIAVSRRRRDVLDALLAGRRATPPPLSGQEALQVIHAARTMPPERFIDAAERLRTTLSEDAAPRGPRIVVAGDGPDTLDLHAAIEDAGGVVVGDYHENGELSVGGVADIDSADPFDALTRHYRQMFSPRLFERRPSDLVDFARAASADAVIFFYYQEEEVLTWEYPDQRRRLEDAGVASLCISGQPYAVRREEVEPPVRALLGRLSGNGGAG